VNVGNEKGLLNLSTMEHGVTLWGTKRRLQENDSINIYYEYNESALTCCKEQV